MKFDPQKHHRHSIRLKDYDYSQAGAYYVTIDVQNRECLFGEIVNDEMVLNDAGKMIIEQWNALLERFLNIELDVYQIMPNHFHGIIVVSPNLDGSPNRAGTRPAPTGILHWAISSARSNPSPPMNTSLAWTIKIGRNFTNAYGKEIIMPALSLSKGTYHPRRSGFGTYSRLHPR